MALTIPRCQVDKTLMLFVQRERLLTDTHLAVVEVGAVNLPLLAESGKQLHGLHRVSPLVVSAPKQ